ncbi:MAG TPA: hypothetical protein VNX26_07920 [Candidatus Acidoferrum sp.]|jgi:hypothetical protein|nr:hypothetical protein [Candidatus Acidoferrum sp.]
MPDDTSRPALSHEARERIRLEEAVRLKVRSELEENGSKRAKSHGLLGFLNSKLGIVVISTILVPAIGGLYTQMRQQAVYRSADNERIMKLMAEFDWRIEEIEFHKDRIQGEPDHDKWVSGFVITKIIVGGPDYYYPTLPEFKQVHLGGIVAQLLPFGDSPGGNVLQTVEQMEHGDLAVYLVGQPANADHTYDVDKLSAQLATLKQFRSRIAPRSWFWGSRF